MDILSNVPFLVRDLRFGVPLGKKIDFEDMLQSANVDTYSNMSIIQSSDKLAEQFKITREELDTFALRSQKRWEAAHKEGLFNAEIVPVKGILNGRDVLLTADESPHTEVTLEALNRLSPVYEGGRCTSGNCCSMNDGAAAIILANDDAVRNHALQPLARIVGWSCSGVEPALLGIACVPAVKSILKATGNQIADLDLIELHETNAAMALSCIKELGFDYINVNLNGGAIAVGHPPGATGARLVMHLCLELRRRKLRRALAAMNAAGGQGLAMLLESV